MNELIDKTIHSIFISDDKQYLKFVTDDGDIVYYAYGDCCSHSWFNDICGFHSLISAKVISVEEIPSSVIHDHGSDLLQSYGYKFVTTGGFASIEFRNESNGWYGGSCNLHEGNTNKITWKMVDDDLQ